MSVRFVCALLALFLAATTDTVFAQPFVNLQIDDTIQRGATIEQDSRVATVIGTLTEPSWRPAIRVGGGVPLTGSLALVGDVSVPRSISGRQILRHIERPFGTAGASCDTAQVITTHRDVLATGVLRREFHLHDEPRHRPAIFGGGGVAFRSTAYDGACVANVGSAAPVNYPYAQKRRIATVALTFGAEDLLLLNDRFAFGMSFRFNIVSQPILGIGSRIVHLGITTRVNL
jgi:hypothetical protein